MTDMKPMTRKEYKQRMQDETDWAPGWEAIDKAFETLYKDQTPAHFGTEFHERAMLGGDQFLDGYSIYDSPNGYKHIVTYGMTELYGNEEAFEGDYSRWGYEMTFKVKTPTAEDCLWVVDMLSNLARYTYMSERYFEAGQFIAGSGTSIHTGVDSAITALLVVEDPEVSSLKTIHGRVEFLQFVGITQTELDKLIENPELSTVLIERLKAADPNMVTDMDRTVSYL